MSTSAGVTGSVIGILATFILLYDDISSKFVGFMHYVGYSSKSYLNVNPTTVTTTQRLMIFPKLYFDLMNVIIPNFISLIRNGDIASLITLFREYLLFLYMPFIIGGVLAATLTGGAAKSISASLMGVLISFIVVEGISFGLNTTFEFSMDLSISYGSTWCSYIR